MQDFSVDNLAILLLFAFTSAGFANMRHRNPLGWAVLGLIFGAVGLLVLLATPPGQPALATPRDPT
ncbi:MAG: hypothetical protein KBG28_13930 [Kofleriaceae bacterium]|jgi:hypothetical protein|nr:hypothetical protein [Kofleriaceae bacterium]MBP9205063.1 hypothetical protein [Kofleriaceae bacterium]